MEPEGIIKLGVVRLGPESEYERFRRWIEEGRHAGMEYLEKHDSLRADPRELLPGARSAIVVALPYDLGDEYPMAESEGPRVAQYARLRDYHRELRDRAETLARRLLADQEVAWRVCVDSAPVLERALASRTARGFIGKNTCFIHPEMGSWLLLAEILTSAELPVDIPAAVDPAVHGRDGGCGACRECQRHCPTGALDEDYRIDSRLCLSYWTIEHRGTIPERFWPWLRHYWFGCDICQLVCPYNLRSEGRARQAAIGSREMPPLERVAVMTQAEYEAWFGGTPLTRAKREGLRRNALIALAVTRHPALGSAIAAAERDESIVLRETADKVRRSEWGGSLRPLGRRDPMENGGKHLLKEAVATTPGPSTVGREC